MPFHSFCCIYIFIYLIICLSIFLFIIFPLSHRIIPDTVLSLFVSNVRILNYYISQSNNPLLAPHYISISLPIALPIIILYRLPAGGVLTHLCELFVTRNATCWNREDVHNWCRATASRLISQYDSDADLLHMVCHSTNCYTALHYPFLPFQSTSISVSIYIDSY